MSPVRLRDDATPWSFFLPMFLAVAGGILLSDIVRHAAGTAFGHGEVQPASANAPARPGQAGDGEHGDGDPDLESMALVEVGPSSGGDVVLLPGPSAALRDGAERACINGTIVMRRPNGWEQGLEDNAPLRCRASSP